MKRPWQIWLLFCLSLAVAVGAMGWLTLHTLQLDRDEAVARRQAELEERVSVALWRMDTMLTPLVGQEVARPYYAYRSSNEAPGGGKGKQPVGQIPSPLLNQPSDHVLVHFQLGDDGQITSPQQPPQEILDWAVSNGATTDNIRQSGIRLDELKGAIDHENLVARLPDETLPSPESVDFPNPQVIDSVAQEQFDGNYYIANLGQQPQDQQLSTNAHNPQMAGPPGSQQGANDLRQRGSRYQSYAQREVEQQRFNRVQPPRVSLVNEGVSRPLWVGDKLLLARKVDIDGRIVVQGCWLNWPKIQRALLEEIADLELEPTLKPVVDMASANHTRMLAGLPVQLVVAPYKLLAVGLTPIRMSLLVAWTGMLLAALAVAVLLLGVISLSERRAAFVSAVTHELRTPLTTFRMYAEMLSQDMVPDAERRKSYLETLRVEADRLSQLVENVLSYARLERTGKAGKVRSISVAELMARTESRLQDRAAQAQMELSIDIVDRAQQMQVRTDPGAVDQILFNLVDNACKYAAGGAESRISIAVQPAGRRVRIRVQDRGPGISAAGLRRLFRPFSKSAEEAAESAPGVGLGLALCQRLAKQMGAALRYDAKGQGACFVLSLPAA